MPYQLVEKDVSNSQGLEAFLKITEIGFHLDSSKVLEGRGRPVMKSEDVIATLLSIDG